MREHNDWSAALHMLQVILEPFQLLVPETSESTRLEIHYIHQADEMRAAVIEAVPSIALRALAKTLSILRAVVVQHIVLAGNIEDPFRLDRLQRLLQGVELRVLRKLREVAR